MDDAILAYCGAPPTPGEATWNLDPWLLIVLAAIPLLYTYAWVVAPRRGRAELACFLTGWLVTAAALVSPLCNLSVALFSARVGQHMLLALVAAPLVAYGHPIRVTSLVYVGLRRPALDRTHLILSTLAFAAALWIWHSPGPYEATFRSAAIYWTMHITTFGAAVYLWRSLLDGFATIGASLLCGFFSMMQMGLLGALLTLSQTVFFTTHSETTWPWGISPLEDQQLGGLIMWIPAGVLFTAYMIGGFGVWLHRFNEQETGSEFGSS